MDKRNKEFYVPLPYRRYVLQTNLTVLDYITENAAEPFEVEDCEDTWERIKAWRKIRKILANPKFAGFLKGMD